MDKNAFTLAEVLITLGIIGVVSAMTLPALVNRTQGKELEAKLQKTYSVFTTGKAADGSGLRNDSHTSDTQYHNKIFAGICQIL